MGDHRSPDFVLRKTHTADGDEKVLRLFLTLKNLQSKFFLYQETYQNNTFSFQKEKVTKKKLLRGKPS